MKRILLLLSLLLCGVNYVVAQNYKVEIVDDEIVGNGDRRVVVTHDRLIKCNIDNRSSYCEVSVLYLRSNDGVDDLGALRLYLLSEDMRTIVGEITQMQLVLSNGEKLSFECKPDGKVGYGSVGYRYGKINDSELLSLLVLPYSALSLDKGYTGAYRAAKELRTLEESTKYLFNQLALYDIVEIKLDEHVVQPSFRSSDLIRSLIKELRLNLPSANMLPDPNRLDHSWARKATPSKPAVPVQKSVAPSHSATKPTNTVAPKPAQPAAKPTTKPVAKSAPTTSKPATAKSDAKEIAKEDRKAVNLMTYANVIARYDHIAPSQLMHSPLALFTSRAIPMDDLVSIVDGAKGVGKVMVSTSSDGKQKSATVHPTEFYCRLRGFEEVPCSLMSVGYDADNQQPIKTSTFTYDLPSSWKRGKVKEYAEAFSNDMHRIGMQWTEEKDRYVGTYNGHYIMISYGGKGDDNFIYVYIRYADEK